jgi:hypothetical protein
VEEEKLERDTEGWEGLGRVWGEYGEVVEISSDEEGLEIIEISLDEEEEEGERPMKKQKTR